MDEEKRTQNLFEIMDELDVDMDTAELLLMDDAEEKDFEQIFENSLEDWPYASEQTQKAYSDIIGNIEEYATALQYQAFCYGYKKGWKAATLNKREEK